MLGIRIFQAILVAFSLLCFSSTLALPISVCHRNNIFDALKRKTKLFSQPFNALYQYPAVPIMKLFPISMGLSPASDRC